MTEEERLILKTFFPYASARQDVLEETNTPLVHYTSADAAMNIIVTKEFWMREASCLNDSREVLHGLDCVIEAYKSAHGKRLQVALNSLHSGITEKIESLFNSWLPLFSTNTFLACFSEHDPEKENELGRLSMWRAYGKENGVALVLKNNVFFNDSDFFDGLYTSPVAYLNDDGLSSEMLSIAENIDSNRAIISSFSEELIVSLIFRALMFASLCTKHPGFEEEREWRLTYLPPFEFCNNIKQGIISVNNTPQIIQKIPLQDAPTHGLTGLNIPDIIERIIIGPSQYAETVKRAFINLLEQAGVTNPLEKVVLSGIPLRV